MPDICYYCHKTATSDEHVPPKAIFPKPKDSPDGIDYRKNLITVRSCDVHNSNKSKDDEYLLYILAMNLTSNDAAKNQFLTKVKRAIQRRPALLNSLLIKFEKVKIHDTENDKWFTTIAIMPDERRLTSIFDHIVRAIYFYETGTVWVGKVSVLIEFMLSPDDVARNMRQAEIVKCTDDALRNVQSKGENIDIFSYQIVEQEKYFFIRLHFYGNSKLSAVLIPQ